jgi:hypothetical protein
VLFRFRADTVRLGLHLRFEVADRGLAWRLVSECLIRGPASTQAMPQVRRSVGFGLVEPMSWNMPDLTAMVFGTVAGYDRWKSPALDVRVWPLGRIDISERYGASRPVIDRLTYETGRLAPCRYEVSPVSSRRSIVAQSRTVKTRNGFKLAVSRCSNGRCAYRFAVPARPAQVPGLNG